MNAIPSADSLVIYWILFSIGSALVCLFALIWAVRTGQFNEPERCARLPLEGVSFGDAQLGREEVDDSGKED
jgi:cbb3-type cytochrome oxidase maturation protein